MNNPTSQSAIVFVYGWALTEKLKANQKGLTKQITKCVKKLLTLMFHTGTANPRLKINASEMHEKLLKRIADGETICQKFPQLQTR
ncbi:4314_t:CDS:2 [Funneliformis geosporum]|nr:4314_t:CDS:2 [Funneliformis geosporum]